MSDLAIGVICLVVTEDVAVVGIRQANGVLDHRVQQLVQVEGRPTDGLKNSTDRRFTFHCLG